MNKKQTIILCIFIFFSVKYVGYQEVDFHASSPSKFGIGHGSDQPKLVAQFDKYTFGLISTHTS